jgi:glycosyltransferase involved in cell wall biosynthesis
MTTRDRPKPLDLTLSSLFQQTIPSSEIVVLDDGSTDDQVADVINKYHGLHMIKQPGTTYDIRRVVKNWNRCLHYARVEGFWDLPYLFITADDCVYPPEYAETLMERMAKEEVVVASGTRGLKPPPDGWKPPEGSGRMINSSFMRQLGFSFPEQAGYEPWIVYEAMRKGMKVACYNDLRYEHVTSFGGSHRFGEWSFMPHALGYDPLFFAARCIKNAFNGDIPKGAALKMFLGYFYAPLTAKRDPSFYRYFSPELRSFVREFQHKRMSLAIRSLMGL